MTAASFSRGRLRLFMGVNERTEGWTDGKTVGRTSVRHSLLLFPDNSCK